MEEVRERMIEMELHRTQSGEEMMTALAEIRTKMDALVADDRLARTEPGGILENKSIEGSISQLLTNVISNSISHSLVDENTASNIDLTLQLKDHTASPPAIDLVELEGQITRLEKVLGPHFAELELEMPQLYSLKACIDHINKSIP